MAASSNSPSGGTAWEIAFQLHAARQSECLQAVRDAVEASIREELASRLGEISRRIDDCALRLQVVAHTVAAIAPHVTVEDMGIAELPMARTPTRAAQTKAPLPVDLPSELLMSAGIVKAPPAQEGMAPCKAPPPQWVPLYQAESPAPPPGARPPLSQDPRQPCQGKERPPRPPGPPPNGPGPTATFEVERSRGVPVGPRSGAT